jgi:hypothetical protein
MGIWKWDEGKEHYLFETEEIGGCLVSQGHFQGVHSLKHKKEGRERVGISTKKLSSEQVARYGDLAGKQLFLLDLYHYLATNLRQGVMGRNMKTVYQLKEKGVEIEFKPQGNCAIQTKALYSIKEPNAIDLEISVRAERDYQDFELWLSSYTPSRKNGAYYYLCDPPCRKEAMRGRWIRPQINDFIYGFYLCYPRDNQAARLTYDGRWGETYQTFLTGCYYAEPIIVVLNEDTGFAYIEMAERKMCPKICGSYIAEVNPKKINDYTPFYTVLFGQDLKEGQTLTARVRGQLVKMGDDWEVPLRLFNEWANKFSKTKVKKAARRLAENIKGFYPEVLEEIRGLAKGVGLPYEAMLIHNLYAELPTACESSLPEECSCIGFIGKDGPILGKNNDGVPDFKDSHILYHVFPEKGYEHLYVTYLTQKDLPLPEQALGQ